MLNIIMKSLMMNYIKLVLKVSNRILYTFKKCCKVEKKKCKAQIITNSPKYTDEELIRLFSDEKPIQAKKKKHKKNTPITHKHVITHEPEIEDIDIITHEHMNQK